ncbi:MAG: hypothetical protein ACP6IY_06835 [Promethearchaeia archaeon]
MIKKGKFKLLSYIIEDSLLFYKSLNRKKKYLAFSIIQTKNNFSLIPVLLKLLEKGFFSYFSVQINLDCKNNYYYIINYQSKLKSEIIKSFNKFCEKIESYDLILLKDKKLEEMYLKIILSNKDSQIEFKNKKGLILIENNKKHKILEIFQIDLKKLNEGNFSLKTFLQFLNDIRIPGVFIANFKYKKSIELLISSYLIYYKKDDTEKNSVEIRINNFFNCEVCKKASVNEKLFFYLFWRYNLCLKTISLRKLLELFSYTEYLNLLDLEKFNYFFEKFLKSNQINYFKINKNMFFISQNYIFLIFENINLKLISNVFKRFYSTYTIYILILNKKNYEKFLEIGKVDLLKRVKILNPKKLNESKLKKLLNLEKPQVNC